MNRTSRTSPLTASILYAALGVAMALPLVHPASAAQMQSAPLPMGARYASGHADRTTAAVTLRTLRSRAHHAAKKATHFNFPYGLAVDQAGNAFVTNFNTNSVAMISPTYKITTNVISQALNGPVSIAVGANEAIFVGNLASGSNGGYVERYAGGTPQLTITANAGLPYSIAADQFNDLFLIYQAGIALDDPNGNSLYAPGYNGYGLISVAVGNGAVYAFDDGNYLSGSGSLYLRTSGLTSITGPTGAANPSAVSCGSGDCWYGDAANNTLTVSDGGTYYDVALSYTPVGVAYDQLHNRVFVADPIDNAIHVYNAQTLALERTLT